MKKEKVRKLNPDIEGPKYGIPFDVVGFQAQTENGTYTELIETELFGVKFMNRKEYIKWKSELSKGICDTFNRTLDIKWDRIVSFKVKYLCEKEDHYI